ncbi:MAG: IS1634 family transposase [Saprospiraceae bacterium]|nr:IS1634 family transposase [Saprospiraceae bacterium]
MYLKVVFKRYDKSGHRVMEYRMVESYRSGDTIKQHNILHLGNLAELPDAEQKKELGKRIDEIVKQRLSSQLNFMQSSDEKIEHLAQKFAQEIIEKKRIDTNVSHNYELVNTDTISNHDVVEIGAEWMCHQALNQLHLDEILQDCEFSEDERRLAYTHIISRAVHPASELATCQWIKQNSGVCELTHYPVDKITKDKLYGISHKLYEHKSKIESRLSTKTNELFDLDDKIMIYDLTNSYYEGQMAKSTMARYGRSKEKRSDAKLVVLAMVVNEQGFIKYSQIYEGNTSDTQTLKDLVAQLSTHTSGQDRKPIVAIDAGIASETNLQMLKFHGYDYLCVSRSAMTRYSVDDSKSPVSLKDNKNQQISLQQVLVRGCTDTYVEVHSYSKENKERSMNEQFRQRFEAGLKQIQSSLTKPRGVKTVSKVYERLGRLKQKYPSINRYYQIELSEEEGKVQSITWKVLNMPAIEGKYLLRTTLNTTEEKIQWKIYNTIREIESTFRTLKTDLDLRPIYHKSDKASQAHLHLGILAYWVVNTIRYQLKKKGIHKQWKHLVQLMNTHKIVTTRLECAEDKVIHIRKFSVPTKEVKNIYESLKFKTKAFNQKKVVVTPNVTKENVNSENQKFSSA